MKIPTLPKIPIPIITSIIIFVLLAAFFKFYGPIQLNVSTKSVTQPSPFSVVGEGTEYTTPDTAIVALGITIDANTVLEAQNKANKTINDIKNAVKKLGVEDKNIKTTNYNIYPNYDYSSNKKNITGYNVNIGISITTENMSTINDVIDTATNLGANEVRNISFDVKDKQKAIDNATKLAIKDAKEKAQKIAKESGINLGKLMNVYISESSNQWAKPMYSAADAGMGGGGGTEVEPGQTEIKVQATLFYETL